jgi:hypothetical protein
MRDRIRLSDKVSDLRSRMIMRVAR